MIKKLQNQLKYFDYGLFIPFILLALIGVVMVYSASSINLSYVTGNTMKYFIRQLIYALLGTGLVLTMAHSRPKHWWSLYVLVGGWFILMGLLVVAKFFTDAVNGANGWINLKVISIQPSEICKLYLVLLLAKVFTIYTEKGGHILRRKWAIKDLNFLERLNLFVPEMVISFSVLAMLGMIGSAPDFGGLGINFMIVLVMFLAYSNYNYRFNVTLIIGGVTFAGIVAYFMQFTTFLNNSRIGYIIRRFTAVFDPFKYENSSGKQLVNSFYAVSNGGLFGRGIGESIQKRGYLPEPYTDFILSIISEELGVIGVTVVLCLLAWMILRIFLIGIRAKSTYAMYFCYGIGTFFAVETFFNVGGAIGLMPLTGVTLPFISYGGSSMIVLAIALGMVMNISARQKRGTEIEIFGK